MQNHYFYVVLASLFGSLIPLQGAINARLAKHLSSQFQASFVSFSFGVFTLFVLLMVTKTGLPDFAQLKKASPVLLIGGVLGALFVTSVIFLMPKIGSVSLIAATITGQLLVALVIDHFGLLSVPVHPLTLKRGLGVFMLMLGVFLVQK